MLLAYVHKDSSRSLLEAVVLLRKAGYNARSISDLPGNDPVILVETNPSEDEKIKGLLGPSCEHIWKTRAAGGDPTDAGSSEMVTVCEKCGYEKDE